MSRCHCHPEEARNRLYRAIWHERLTVAEAIRRYGISRGAAYYIAERLRKRHGDPPPCGCGRPGLHKGRCMAQIGGKRPACPRCGGITTKAGRAPRAADGSRPQMHGCKACGHIFVGIRTRRVAALRDWERQIHSLVWVSGEKQEYVVEVTGLSRTTVFRFVRQLKAKYGDPYQRKEQKAA